MLQLKNIFKSYKTGDFTQVALNDVSLNFRKSEFVAILGPSGSGKTTFLNIVGGLDRCASGDLIINGKSTKRFKDKDWDAYRNKSIGFVFQSYNLIPHLNIVDNVEMGMTLSGVPAKKKHKKAIEVLTKAGLKDHLHKKPNQLSGGQMQRVAIARALANDPDIILADEPTGALDSQTSEQILDLIKEIAKDKLIIMVTHNKELAEQYADRIIRFSDGKVIADSNPYEPEQEESDYKLKKTSMSFFTALKLSGKNIITKKWRTFLTAFASSIGIIGIALILSLSNGFDKQIKDFETSTLSNFPIIITQANMDIDITAMQQMRQGGDLDEFPTEQVVYPFDITDNMVIHTNVFAKEYIDYVKKLDPSLIDGVSLTRSVNLNLLRLDGDTAVTINPSNMSFTSFPKKPGEGIASYLEKRYDLIYGELPQSKTDLVLVLDQYNRVYKDLLEALGIDTGSDPVPFDKIVGYEFKLILNDDFYIQKGDYFTVNGANFSELYNSDKAVTLRIAGIVRPLEDSKISILQPGIMYPDELVEFFIEDAKKSKIVLAQEKANYNVLTGEVFPPSNSGMPSIPGMGGAMTKEVVLAALGADSIPVAISIYPYDFDAKEKVVDYLEAWNEGKEEKDRIEFTDMAAMVTKLSGGIMDAITIVLIAFAAISLVVSLIMIGIITYISVLERTTEIGVLRALGARKKDIARVFNAETFIIGAFSGLLGIGIAYLLTIPANNVLYNLTDLKNVAQLNPIHAFVLVVLSVLLTMLGGLIPARIAAKKDPVEALRAE